MLVRHKIYKETEVKKDPTPEISWKVKLKNCSVYLCAVLSNGYEIDIVSISEYGILNIIPIPDSENIGLDINKDYISMVINPRSGELDTEYAKDEYKINIEDINTNLNKVIDYFYSIQERLDESDCMTSRDINLFDSNLKTLRDIRDLFEI